MARVDDHTHTFGLGIILFTWDLCISCEGKIIGMSSVTISCIPLHYIKKYASLSFCLEAILKKFFGQNKAVIHCFVRGNPLFFTKLSEISNLPSIK